ncbi:hypothetical protein [Streptomyces maremycinicus]|uniref:hypothetical protein n=1 Tax=Streptomyces maremycinicus TaxID=1679753 RepID=UPI001F1F3EC6|nr:hypothetical protein [Streptomyces sp. NBRC 110468]
MSTLAPEDRGAEQHEELDTHGRYLLGLVDMEKETMQILNEGLHPQRTVLAETALGDDPLLRLQQETQLGDGSIGLRATTHPEEIVITGIPVMCPQCGARRDWMVICDRDEVSIRCRCAHQWVERELTRADYEAMIDVGGQDYPNLEAAAQAAGYDGTFAGVYVD